MLQVKPAKQGLDSLGGHLLTARRVIIDHAEGQRHEEQPTVLQQKILEPQDQVNWKYGFMTSLETALCKCFGSEMVRLVTEHRLKQGF